MGAGRAGPCGHHGCTADFSEVWSTWPNVITAVRTVATVVLCGLALGEQREDLLLAALVCYWIGDMADGLLARITDRETRTGAVLDVLADRLSVCLVVIVYLAWHPEATVPGMVFLTQFVVLDAYLTLSFRNFSILSPNYFGLVDATIYRLNWSPPAKATNTGAVILVVLLTGSMVAATALAAAVLAVKAYSTARLARIPVPTSVSGCAVRDQQIGAQRISIGRE